MLGYLSVYNFFLNQILDYACCLNLKKSISKNGKRITYFITVLYTVALFSTKIKSEFCLRSFVCQPEAHLKLDDFLQLNGYCKVKLIGISHHCQAINEITHSKSVLQGPIYIADVRLHKGAPESA